MDKKSIAKQGKYFDFTLLFILMFLIVFGLVLLYSASSYISSINNDGDSGAYLRSQMKAVGVGIIIMTGSAIFPYKFYKKLHWAAYIFSAAMILMVLTPLNYGANGATRWFKIAGFSVQPAEICKIGAIIFVAALLSRMGTKFKQTWKGYFFPMVPIGILCLMLLLITRNLSSALLVGLIGTFMIMISEKKNIWPYVILAFIVLVCVVVTLLLVNGLISGEAGFRFERVLAWLDPEGHADGKGYQILQSLYGIGSGGIWGKGLGKSVLKLGYMPEAENDMIFSIICEEIGFAGGASLIALYIMLLWRIRDVTLYCSDYFGNMLVTGVFIHIALQVVLNIAVVTNLIPNTGIPLPFVSAGGSSVVCLMFEMGIVFNVGRNAKFTEENNTEKERIPERPAKTRNESGEVSPQIKA